jgi:putative ABC transport system permease protein
MLRAGVAALRASPLRTALSAIGVVIGVGAMVSVLALSDGVERAFRERMAADGRLVTVRVAPRTTDVVDGQAFARRETVAFTPADARALAARLGDTADVHLLASTPGLVAAVAPGTAGMPPAPRGVVLRGVLRPPPGAARRGLAAGRFFTGRRRRAARACWSSTTRSPRGCWRRGRLLVAGPGASSRAASA